MTERVTIIPADNTVIVGGFAIGNIDLSWITGVHAITWDGTKGEIQRKGQDGLIAENVRIDSIAQYQKALDDWAIAKEALEASEEVQREDPFTVAIQETQKRLDRFAQTRGYDGILSLCTYATDPDPKFAAEGQRGVVLRSTTWAALRAIKEAVLKGLRPIPASYSEIEPELPALTWDT